MTRQQRTSCIVTDGPPLDRQGVMNIFISYITHGDIDGYLSRIEQQIIERQEAEKHAEA